MKKTRETTGAVVDRLRALMPKREPYNYRLIKAFWFWLSVQDQLNKHTQTHTHTNTYISPDNLSLTHSIHYQTHSKYHD